MIIYKKYGPTLREYPLKDKNKQILRQNKCQNNNKLSQTRRSNQNDIGSTLTIIVAITRRCPNLKVPKLQTKTVLDQHSQQQKPQL